MNIYQEKILDHYHNPKNFGDDPKNPTNAELENISCGDRLKIYVNLKDNKIKSYKFSGEGCAIAIASASILGEHMTGKSLEYLEKFDMDQLIDLLGIELTMSRLKCAGLSLETLKKAVKNSTKKKEATGPE